MLRVEAQRTGRAMTEVLRGWIANYLDGRGYSELNSELQPSKPTTIVENSSEPIRLEVRIPTTDEMQQFAPHFDWSAPKADWSKAQYNAFFDKRDELNGELQA